MFTRLQEWWNSWVGDRETERAIRDALTRLGLKGSSAKLSGVRLVAVKRPGWLQVFYFDASVNLGSQEEPQPRTYFGLLRQDERYNRMEIRVLNSTAERRKLFQEWSDGLLQLKNL